MVELGIPNSEQNACSGAVRNMVNWLPFWEKDESAGVPAGMEGDLGESSIATAPPFSVPWTACKVSAVSQSQWRLSHR